MSVSSLLYLTCFVIQRVSSVRSQNVSIGETCILPPHPSFGWWSYINEPSKSSPGLRVPKNSILKVQCQNTYKLDGCLFLVCVGDNWLPKMGQCLKTCPAIYSTSTTKVTCTFKGQETENCTEPLEGTLAQFKCASFYEDTRLSKSKAICVGGSWSENIPKCTPVCGRVVVKQKPTLIVSGIDTKKGDFPWQIALYTLRDKELICGGSLLTEKVILTAAHCITNDYGTMHPKDNYVVVAGKYHRKFNHPEDQNQTQTSQIHKMFISDKYEGDEQDYEGDIAIIVTKISFKFSNTIQPVCIDWSKKLEDVVFGPEKQKGYVSGWGNTRENSDPASELRSLSVPSISRKEYRNFLPPEYLRYMTHDKFCAGYIDNGTSVCKGDSGGGLVFQKENRFFIAGIVSLAPLASATEGGCDSQQYGLYTLVFNYTDDFILKKIVEFKPENDECRDCTTTTERTGTDRPETTGSRSPCRLPNHPEFGKWSLPPRPSGGELQPGMLVKSGILLGVTCHDNYKYEIEKPVTIVCLAGTWSDSFGKCLRPCPSVPDSPQMKITCFYEDSEIQNCTNVLDGTVAKFQCIDFYEFSNSVGMPAVCRDGEWSHLPECVHECGWVSPRATTEKYPWHVNIYTKEKNGTKSLRCGGSLISLQMVITAAHCISDSDGKLNPQENYIVVAGKYHMRYDHPEDVRDAQFNTVKKILVPPRYKGDIENWLGDIGIVVVEKPFIPWLKVQPVCIFRRSLGEVPINRHAILSGFSQQKKSFEILKDYKFRVISTKNCVDSLSESYKAYVTPDKFCAKYFSNDSFLCEGNYGGGLVVKEDNKHYLIGILSLMTISTKTLKCDPYDHVFFTNIDSYVDNFILDAEARYRN